jgi:hypothetical protein
VRLNLLSQRVLKRAESGHRGAAKQQRALAKFLKGFLPRWRARRYCAPEYVTGNCGHVQSAL